MTLLEKTIDQIAVPRKGRGRPRKNPKRIIADKAYDSDPLRRRLKRRGIELICPYRKNRGKRRYHDGRKLRRYRRRWKVERTFAWLGNYRRLKFLESFDQGGRAFGAVLNAVTPVVLR